MRKSSIVMDCSHLYCPMWKRDRGETVRDCLSAKYFIKYFAPLQPSIKLIFNIISWRFTFFSLLVFVLIYLGLLTWALEESSRETYIDLDLHKSGTSGVQCFHLKNTSNNSMHMGMDNIELIVTSMISSLNIFCA